jgi:hypothetical protein
MEKLDELKMEVGRIYLRHTRVIFVRKVWRKPRDICGKPLPFAFLYSAGPLIEPACARFYNRVVRYPSTW